MGIYKWLPDTCDVCRNWEGDRAVSFHGNVSNFRFRAVIGLEGRHRQVLAYKSYRQKAVKLNRPKDREDRQDKQCLDIIFKEKTNYLLLMLMVKIFSS
jgi:hypothetical protein